MGTDLKGVVADVTNSVDATRAKRNADFYEPLDMKQAYTQLKVAGVAKVNDHDTYEVVATPANDLPERLYFDTLTGLLLRKITVLPSQLGDSPFQVDYDDYRVTNGGVRFPFTIRMTPGTLGLSR